MKYDLPQAVIDKLKSFFNRFHNIDKVDIFGSRARGDNTPKSDIDICIYSSSISSEEFSKLRAELNELPILYKIDIVHFENSNNELKANILKDSKLLFE